MLVYDSVESTVIDRSYDVVVVCYVDDGWLVVVVPFVLAGCWCVRGATVPVAVVPFDVFPEPLCGVAVL